MGKHLSASGFFPHTCPSSGGVQRLHPPLPLIESIFYLVTGIGSIIYATYELYRTSDKYLMYLGDDFVDGWSFIGRKKDYSDYEWEFWYSFFWKVLPYGLGHIVIARVVEYKFLEHRKTVFLIYSLFSVTSVFGYRAVLFLSCHAVICFLASSVGSFIFVWIISLFLLSTLNYDDFKPIITTVCDLTGSHDYYLFAFVLAFAVIRYTSFCLERARYIKGNKSNEKEKKVEGCSLLDEQENKVEGYSLLDLLLYIFYLPSFFTGPIITYDKFRVQINSTPAPWTKQRIITSIKGFIRVFFWATFIEITHHFLYYNSIPRNIRVLQEMPIWALMGLAYLQGQFFMVKYVVFFDLPGQVARLDDLDPPLGPKCISYIYRYSDMWKFFDRGLYIFLKKYIYIPLGGSQGALSTRIFGSMLCFLYIFVWHGQSLLVFFWCLANFLLCLLELIGSELEKSQPVNKIKTLMSPAMERRIRCMFCIPLFLMSIFAIFYFFGGVYVGRIFVDRMFLQASALVRCAVFFFFYCNLQNAMAFERWFALKHIPHKEE